MAERVGGCEENGALAIAAQACLKKLGQEEGGYGLEISRLADEAEKNQNGDLKASQEKYRFTAASMEALQTLANTAFAEMKEYETFTAVPPLALAPSLGEIARHPESWYHSVGCYRDTITAIEKIRVEFQRKAAMYRSREKEANAHSKSLHMDSSNFGSLTKSVKGSNTDRVPSGSKSPRRQSDITGTKKER